MESLEAHKIREFLDLPRHLTLIRFQEYVTDLLSRKPNKKATIEELDRDIGILYNHVLALSLLLKQKHLLCEHPVMATKDDMLYTRQEVAVKYRVSQRTVTNWIADGLETVAMGGVRRISEQALREYVRSSRAKKFNWKSIVRR